MAPTDRGTPIAIRVSRTIKVKTLRTKLLIGLVPTLAILVGLGLWAIVMFYRLGGNIDVILRENYRSVLAAEGMKEAIERMDSGLLFAVGGRRPARPRAVRRESAAVRAAPRDRAGEHHVPGEQELADELDEPVPAATWPRPTASSRCRPSRRSAGRGLLRRAAADLRRDPRAGRRGADLEPGQHDGDGPPRPGRTPRTSIRLMIGALIAAVALAVGGRACG